jgi:NAD(P) transhydrogenase subunit alpha
MKLSKKSYKGVIKMEAVFLTFILMLAIFLGFELINKVPATLHTPLMSGANAISGITIVGAIGLAGTGQQDVANWLSTAAVAFASINVIGGYLVTDRMLAMFKKRGD